MRHTVVFKLSAALADAVAVEWTDVPAPEASGKGWEPCTRLAGGSWRMSSTAGGEGHWRSPGAFKNIALRYRLEPAGPWSPISDTRKEITLVGTEPEQPADPKPADPKPADPLPIPPVLVAAPALAGTGTIGTAVTAGAGQWTGEPAPALGFQWLRNGKDIAGATAASYTPVPADDLCALSCRVEASNVAGRIEAVTAALTVRYAPPKLVGPLFDEVFDEGTGPQTLDIASAFAGENLLFAVKGAGASIDSRRGILTVSTDKALAGEEVEVSAANSGGSVKAAFLLTVEPVVPPQQKPRQPVVADWDRFTIRLANGKWTGVIVTFDSALPDVAEVEHIANGQVGSADEDGHYEPTAAFDLPGFTVPAGQKWWITHNRATDKPFERDAGTFWNIRFRYRNGSSSLKSPAATNFYTFTEAMLREPVQEPATPTPPPAPAPSRGYRLMAFRPQTAAEQNIVGGCMEQHHHATEASYSEPNFVINAQDILGVWGSEDFGRTWSHLGNEGLMARQMIAANIDPANANVMVALGISNYDVSQVPYAGFYKSTDRGRTWEFKTHVLHAHWERGLQNIAWSPATRTLPIGQHVWYAAVFRREGQSSVGTDLSGVVMRSGDGGESWQVRATVPLGGTGNAVRGRLRTCWPHPTNANIVYMWTSAGLFRSADGGAAWTNVSGTGGLPWGGGYTLEINPNDPNEMYTVVGGVGLFRTTNGGGAWTQIAAPAMNIQKVAVGMVNRAWAPVASRRLFITGKINDTTQGQLRVSQNGGASWTQPPVSTLPGWPTWQSGWHTTIADPRPPIFNMTRVLPHQIDGNQIFVHALSHNHRSDNGGQSFGYSGTGFTGITWSLFKTMKPAFSADPKRFCFGVHDIGCMITKTGGDWFWHAGVAKPTPGTHGSLHTIAMHPTSENMIVGCVGAIWGGDYHIIRTNTHHPQGGNWTNVLPNSGFQLFMHWNRHNPNIVYASNYRSTNQGANWGAYPSNIGSVCGVFHGDNNVIYGRTGTQLMWSQDGGNTASLFVNYGYGMHSGDTRNFILAVHPTDRNVIWTKSANNDLALFNRATGQWKTDFGMNARTRALYSRMPANYPVSLIDVAVDPQDPNTVYVAAGGVGYITIWRTTNAMAANPAWENISFQWPRVSAPTLAVHPMTGDLMMAGDGFGSVRCLPPPAARSHASFAGKFPVI